LVKKQERLELSANVGQLRFGDHRTRLGLGGIASLIGMARIALADQIVDLARKKVIPTPFGVEHFRKHVSGFSEKHVITVLPNYEKDGDMVRRAGQRPRFQRVSDGLYRVL
jgi:hypothetical protein